MFSTGRLDTGSMTVLEYPDGGPPVLRCSNYTSHLGRFARPVADSSVDAGVGLESLF